MEWRRSGKIQDSASVRDRQVEYDLKDMIAVLNWAAGSRLIPHSPWSAEIRRTQSWFVPRGADSAPAIHV